MTRTGRIAAALALGLLTSTSALAQSGAPYDATKFWEELQKQGGQVPANFDRKKFFEQMEQQGSQSMDPRKFFEELQKQGGQLPTAFDGKKFFEVSVKGTTFVECAGKVGESGHEVRKDYPKDKRQPLVRRTFEE